MKVVGLREIAEFARTHADARATLAALQRELEAAKWSGPMDIKRRYPRASLIGDGDVVFDVSGGKYRLHARFSYAMGIVLIVRVGTHAEYDRWTF